MSESLSNRELLNRYREGDETAFNLLIERNMGLVKSIAKRFIGRGTEFEDLVQIGAVGLIKASNSFDLNLSFEFSTYAFSMILGEIRRFLRDDGPIKVSRSIKKNCAVILGEKEKYVNKFGHEPSIGILCELCGLDRDDVILSIGAMSPILSFNGGNESEFDEICFEDKVGRDYIGEYIEILSLNQALETLTHEERTIITLRYGASLTQSSVAKRLNMSQVKISRTEKKIIEKLRRIMIQ